MLLPKGVCLLLLLLGLGLGLGLLASETSEGGGGWARLLAKDRRSCEREGWAGWEVLKVADKPTD